MTALTNWSNYENAYLRGEQQVWSMAALLDWCVPCVIHRPPLFMPVCPTHTLPLIYSVGGAARLDHSYILSMCDPQHLCRDWCTSCFLYTLLFDSPNETTYCSTLTHEDQHPACICLLHMTCYFHPDAPFVSAKEARPRKVPKREWHQSSSAVGDYGYTLHSVLRHWHAEKQLFKKAEKHICTCRLKLTLSETWPLIHSCTHCET